MSVVNTTYNFNQPSMNFGQSLLYGIFGSLTGGMGCFGGGNGYGGYGMGMGGSLFSMIGSGIGGYSYGGYGYGGYGCGCGTFNTGVISSYADTMFGVQLGTTFLQCAIYGISRAFSGRGGNEREVEVKTFDDYKKDAEVEIGIDYDMKIDEARVNAANIKSVSEDIVNKFAKIAELDKTISGCDKAISTANDNLTLLNANLKTENLKLQNLKNAKNPDAVKISEQEEVISKLKVNIKNAEEEIKTKQQEKSKAEQQKTKLSEELNKLTESIKKDTGIEITETTTKAKIDTAANKLIDDAKDKKDKAIEKKAKELQANDIQAANRAETNATRYNEINKVDGNSLTRTRVSKLIEKQKSGTKDYDGDDVQGALAAFKKANNNSDKKYWHNILHSMSQNGDLMNSINSDIAKIVKKYFSKEYKPE